MVLSILIIVLNGYTGKKKSVDRPAEGVPRRMVEITGSDVNIFVMPAPEDLDEVEKCAESLETFSMDGDGKTDLEQFSSGNTSEEGMREVLGNLIRSGMEIRDTDGRRLTLEQVIGQLGESEEVVKEDDGRNLMTDPDTTRKRRGRMEKALDRLNSDRKPSNSNI